MYDELGYVRVRYGERTYIAYDNFNDWDFGNLGLDVPLESLTILMYTRPNTHNIYRLTV